MRGVFVAEFGKNILRVRNGNCAGTEKTEGSLGSCSVNVRRDRKNFSSLVKSKVCGNGSSASCGGFNYADPKAHSGNDSVPDREKAGAGLRIRRKFAYNRAVCGNKFLKFNVFRRKSLADSAALYRNGFSSCGKAGFV